VQLSRRSQQAFLPYPHSKGAAMNDNKYCENLDARDLNVWENEGGALDRHDMNHHYGRRIEPNRSWTIYHVFTGGPAELEGWSMTGLGESHATATMIFLDARNAKTRESKLQQTFATRF
jgi:hypothetical protein